MSNTLHFKPWGDNPWGFPADYPQVTKENQSGQPPVGWLALDSSLYADYMSSRAQAANAARDLMIAAQPVAPVASRVQDTRTVLDRLTVDEKNALMNCTIPDIRMLMFKAASTGTIHEGDKDFPSAKAGLAALGIIAADRWDALFAQ